MSMMDRRMAASLDRYITGNYGMDQFRNGEDDADDGELQPGEAWGICECCEEETILQADTRPHLCAECAQEHEENLNDGYAWDDEPPFVDD